jgi:hypothetical protein
MLRSKNPALHLEHIALHLLRLRMLALDQEGGGEIAHRIQSVWMLRSKRPALHVEQLAEHWLRLCVLALAMEGVGENACCVEPIFALRRLIAHTQPELFRQSMLHRSRKVLLARGTPPTILRCFRVPRAIPQLGRGSRCARARCRLDRRSPSGLEAGSPRGKRSTLRRPPSRSGALTQNDCFVYYKGHVGPAQWKGGDWAGSKKRK